MQIHSHFPIQSFLGQQCLQKINETCVNSHLQLSFSLITLTNQMSLSVQNRRAGRRRNTNISDMGTRRCWTLSFLEILPTYFFPNYLLYVLLSLHTILASSSFHITFPISLLHHLSPFIVTSQVHISRSSSLFTSMNISEMSEWLIV